MRMQVYDATPCELGEGPLWHPERGQLFWCDINGRRLFTREGDRTRAWDFDEPVSAAGWVDRDTLIVATASGLWRFDIGDGARQRLVDIEAGMPETRSNDGRADPMGGFWIGTMRLDEAPGDGAIYRYFRGELRKLYPRMQIPNAICFAPDGRMAYFTDTATGIVRTVALDDDGWPDGDPQDWLDLRDEGRNPDGAVTDAAGNVWLAEWGSARVACYGPDARFHMAVAVPSSHSSCPALGGPGLSTLFCTTARKGLTERGLAAEPLAGQTFAISLDGLRGRPEHRVIL